MESEKQQMNGVEGFQMPLHYPRYAMKDYQNMPEWKLDRLLAEYGLSATGDLDYKRKFAMGAFLWPDDFHANQKPKAYYGPSTGISPLIEVCLLTLMKAQVLEAARRDNRVQHIRHHLNPPPLQATSGTQVIITVTGDKELKIP
ncbi:hypothetical protein PVK06_036750 [Gossypium arboreum]|uniref:DUF7722 domain-containing protein n=1 Tax=Gossypium arboreum TaxID=29729 RepID=A0ABR0NLE8_GOSAR|nr:hypothetical protein PVK06_036750 [Gossypium arboreum]